MASNMAEVLGGLGKWMPGWQVWRARRVSPATSASPAPTPRRYDDAIGNFAV